MCTAKKQKILRHLSTVRVLIFFINLTNALILIEPHISAEMSFQLIGRLKENKTTIRIQSGRTLEKQSEDLFTFDFFGFGENI